jgi:hypothetical protein
MSGLIFAPQTVYGQDKQAGANEKAKFAGSAKCAKCHRAIYKSFSLSGHPFKLQKIDGKPPRYPGSTSPGVPNPPAGMAWSDVSYVIGGYGRKAHFMDRDGYIMTGAKDRQYNLANRRLGRPASWTGYDAKSAPRKPYTCGACHNTGWHQTGPDGPHQDDLPGIHGTWVEAGVGCEACHGPGADHAAKPWAAKPSTDDNCSGCHARGDVTKIDAEDGLVRHHEQYEELLASPHLEQGCSACHDPHKSTTYAQGGYKGDEKSCVKCHEIQANVFLGQSVHNGCTSCHMPFAGKSALAAVIEHEDGAMAIGDVRSHLFRITTDPAWNMFSDDGKWLRLDTGKRGALSIDGACLGCHQSKGRTWASQNAGRIHGQR